MKRRSAFTSASKSFAVGVLAAALLAACGGGGSDSGNSAPAVDDAAATADAGNAAVIGSDTTAALDTSVTTAQAAIAQSATASATGMTALAASGSTTTTVDCPGGGTAVLTISGGTPQSQLNGKLDTGESYELVFSNCRGKVGATAVNGTLGMTVDNATSTNVLLSLNATGLVVALQKSTASPGTVTLNGSAQREISVSNDAAGNAVYTWHFTSSSIVLVTRVNARQSTFALSNVDLTRTATANEGELQPTSLTGTFTLSGTLANGRTFSHVVTAQGSVSYSASGTPTAGTWMVTKADAIITVTIADSTATITVDQGKDGTIDRTITLQVPQLESSAR